MTSEKGNAETWTAAKSALSSEPDGAGERAQAGALAKEADDSAGDDASQTEIADTEEYLKGLLEALLFVADRPLELKELARAIKLDKKRVVELIELLKADYAGRGLQLAEVAEGFAFRTNPEYASTVRAFLAQRPVRLSRAQLETLAIIAYRQPITRPEIDDVRGVDCGPVLKGLLERDLIRILGKKEEPGRPMLYGTTPGFLELFNLPSLSELPTLKEFTELSEESRRDFEHELGEPVFDDAEANAAEPEATANLDTQGEQQPGESQARKQHAGEDQSGDDFEDGSSEALDGEADETRGAD